ncbi:general substrate transporter [Chlamydoabsidia padenii]|nr:general substrate transporter [Chlamydoabsidia padenii]
MRNEPNERSPLLNDKQTPKPTCTVPLLLSTFIPSLAGFLCGYDQTVIETTLALPNFQHHFFYGNHLTAGINPFDYLTFGFFSMAILGTLYGGYVCDKAGRKQSLIGALLVFVLGNLLDMGSSHSLVFLIGRSLVGFGSGMIMVASPCLITELSPPDLRACLVGFFTLMIMAGNLSGYYTMLAIGPNISASMTSSSSSSPPPCYLFWFDDDDWRTPVMISSYLGLFLIWVQWQLPESPRWLIFQQQEARHIIAYLEEQPIDSPTVHQQYNHINTSNKGMPSSSTTSYMGFRAKRTLLGAAGLVIANWLTGHGTLTNYYAPAIFYAAGLQETTHPLAATGCIRSVALAATAISLGWCVDQCHRKHALFFGGVIMLMCHLGLGAVFQWASVVDWQTGSLVLLIKARTMTVTCVYLFSIAYSFTWGSLVLVTTLEWFDIVHRAKGVALMTALGLAIQWIQLVSSPWYFWIAPCLIFFFFALATVVSSCFVYCWVPNTTAKSLEDIALD